MEQKMPHQHTDLRDVILASVVDSTVTAAVIAETEGMIAGMKQTVEKGQSLGLEILYQASDGTRVEKSEKVLLFRGTPKQVAMAEECLIGMLAKPSGIATTVNEAVGLASGRLEIVSGAWKKMPPEIKFVVREAIATGGGNFRIINGPFIYLDKNYVRILGGIAQTLQAVKELRGMQKVIQLKGETADVSAEAREAVKHGADIIMVDTGNLADARAVAAVLTELGVRQQVKLAFAGGIKIKDIPALASEDIDILDIGAQVVDAPLLDFRLDVLHVRHAQDEASEPLILNLLEKTELWIEDIFLNEANLTDIAAKVAEILDLQKSDVLVVDVRESHITLDITCQIVNAQSIGGKEAEILRQIAVLPGVKLGEFAGIHSAGILGMIALEPEDAAASFELSRQMAREIKDRVARRVKVFSSGFEVKQGMIQDTNAPLIEKLFKREGYTVAIGEILEDEKHAIARALQRASEDGYGWVITTGGVGAEDKDHTVEAVLQLDSEAATPWIVKFQKGTGRHVKEGVRIAVGELGSTRFVSLPGPNDEVRVAMDVLLETIHQDTSKHILADKIATALRNVWHHKSANWQHHHNHDHHIEN